ncbi:MAG: hypothetical protein AB7F32_09785 [Victivallaceae bacterium]
MNTIKRVLVLFFCYTIIIFLTLSIIFVAALPFIRYHYLRERFYLRDKMAFRDISKHAADSPATLYQIYVKANESDHLQLCDFVMMSKNARKHSKAAGLFSNTIVSEKVFNEYTDYSIQYKGNGEFTITNQYSDPTFTITGQYKK